VMAVVADTLAQVYPSQSQMKMSKDEQTLYAPPNDSEDWGRRNKRGNPDFRLTFQWFVAQIEYSLP
jgi:hypothetical protein